MTMKTLTITAVVLLLLTVLGRAQDTQQVFKNSNGQTVGRAVTNNVGTQFYDASGRNTGRSTTNNAGTTFYNSSGQMTGRTSSSGRK